MTRLQSTCVSSRSFTAMVIAALQNQLEQAPGHTCDESTTDTIAPLRSGNQIAKLRPMPEDRFEGRAGYGLAIAHDRTCGECSTLRPLRGRELHSTRQGAVTAARAIFQYCSLACEPPSQMSNMRLCGLLNRAQLRETMLSVVRRAKNVE